LLVQLGFSPYGNKTQKSRFVTKKGAFMPP